MTFTTRAKRSPKSQPKFSNKRREGLIRYDVALLELETPVDFDQFPHIRPVCLPDTEDLQLDLTERDGVVAGWGVTEVEYKLEMIQADNFFNVKLLT